MIRVRLFSAAVACCVIAGQSMLFGSDLILLNTYETGLPTPHAAAFDPFRDSIWLHGSFSADFVEMSRSGVFTGNAFAQAGDASDDSDITIIEEPINIGGTMVPAGTALFGTGDDFSGPGNDAHLYAIDPVTGVVLAEQDLPGSLLGTNTSNNIVGIGHSTVSDTLFFTSYVSDGVMEYDPATGSIIREFTLSPPGTTSFNIFYGDIEYNEADGLLYAAGVQPIIRVVTTTGDFVRDYDLAPLGVEGQLSGIGIDAGRQEIWVTNTMGDLYQLAIPEPSTFACMIIVSPLVILRSRRTG